MIFVGGIAEIDVEYDTEEDSEEEVVDEDYKQVNVVSIFNKRKETFHFSSRSNHSFDSGTELLIGLSGNDKLYIFFKERKNIHITIKLIQLIPELSGRIILNKWVRETKCKWFQDLNNIVENYI